MKRIAYSFVLGRRRLIIMIKLTAPTLHVSCQSPIMTHTMMQRFQATRCSRFIAAKSRSTAQKLVIFIPNPPIYLRLKRYHLSNRLMMSPSISTGFVVGEYRLKGTPSLETKNFVKFHFMLLPRIPPGNSFFR